MLRTLFLLFFLLFPFLNNAYSAPSIEASLSKTAIKRDETTELTLKLQWSKAEGGYSFAIPDLPLQYLEITNRSESQETFVNENQEWIRKVFTFELAPKDSGQGSVEGFTIRYVSAAALESGSGQFQISPLKVTISKTRSAQNKFASPHVLWISGSVVLAGVAGLVLFMRGSRAKKRIAPASLQADTKREVIKKRIQNTSYYSETSLHDLSLDLRAFLTETYGLEISSTSDGQILDQLREKNLPAEEIKSLEGILNQLRDAKFAGGRLSESEFGNLKKDIAIFIDGKHIQSFSPTN